MQKKKVSLYAEKRRRRGRGTNNDRSRRGTIRGHLGSLRLEGEIGPGPVLHQQFLEAEIVIGLERTRHKQGLVVGRRCELAVYCPREETTRGGLQIHVHVSLDLGLSNNLSLQEEKKEGKEKARAQETVAERVLAVILRCTHLKHKQINHDNVPPTPQTGKGRSENGWNLQKKKKASFTLQTRSHYGIFLLFLLTMGACRENSKSIMLLRMFDACGCR